tara:strand:- start:591 stop:1406 length:816 start_codon:yes stop_codon:yes gene_type:complete
MPEGPETKRMADDISRTVKKKKISSAQFLHPAIEVLNNRNDLLITDVFSKGKSIIIRLNTGQSIVTHNQLYGKWTINLLNTNIRHNRKLRIEIVSGKKVARLWSATDIVLLNSVDENKHHYLKNLGPDILSSDTNESIVLERLLSKTFVNRNIGGLLLNQHFIAGLGNYLRSEILFFSGLMPTLRPNDISKNKLRNLAESIKNISVRAYKNKGRTIDNKDFQKRYGNSENFRLIRHMVFARMHQPCFHCGNSIDKIIQNSRRLYLCKTCQS